MFQVLQRPPPKVSPYLKIHEVLLGQVGYESTLVVNCGATEMRVIIDGWVYARELREFCEKTKGWHLKGRVLYVTDIAGDTTQYAAEKADKAVVQPTVKKVEWQKQMGAKG